MITGLTGGIGSGKTIVARVLALLGAAVFYSDEVARQIYRRDDIAGRVKALLGDAAYLDRGIINKQFISDKIFSDPAMREGLNSIIHPAVAECFEVFTKLHSNKIIIKESALLFEAGIASTCDQIIVVAAGEELRTSRVMERDRLSRDEVMKKIRNQLPQEEKIKRADYVIWNDEKELVLPEILRIYQQLLAMT
jgi:dephospho-CoA kinase